MALFMSAVTYLRLRNRVGGANIEGSLIDVQILSVCQRNYVESLVLFYESDTSIGSSDIFRARNRHRLVERYYY